MEDRVQMTAIARNSVCRGDHTPSGTYSTTAGSRHPSISCSRSVCSSCSSDIPDAHLKSYSTHANSCSNMSDVNRLISVEKAKILALLIVIGAILYHGLIHFNYGLWLLASVIFTYMYSIILHEVSREPPEVADSQILGNIRVRSLKRLPQLYMIGALRSP